MTTFTCGWDLIKKTTSIFIDGILNNELSSLKCLVTTYKLFLQGESSGGVFNLFMSERYFYITKMLSFSS